MTSTNSASPATSTLSSPAARLGRLLLVDGYRGPLALAVVLALLALGPQSGLRGMFGLLLAVGAMFGRFAVLVPPLGIGLATVVTAGVAAFVIPRRDRIRRPGNSVLLGWALADLAALLAFSLPATDWDMLGLAVFGTVLLVPLWLSRQLCSAPAALAHPSGNWRWAVPPLLLAATVTLIQLQVPQQARFEASRPAMTTFAEHALAERTLPGSTDRGTDRLPQPGRIGGYLVQDVEAVGSGLRFTVPAGGFFEVVGYAYLPDGVPAETHGHTYTHVSGAWYSWTDNGDF